MDWVDHAKGMCIILVVMMHSTLGVEKAADVTGWMHYLVQFAKPFRMPDFFLISGLFLGLVIDRPWLRYLDRKVVHFAYFYVLWVTLQFAVKSPQWIAGQNSAADILAAYAWSFVHPFGTLWFIYILPVFFVVTRLAKPVPAWILLGVAALLEIAPIHTGWVVADEFAARYVYFLAGYLFATRLFSLAAWARDRTGLALLFLAIWFAGNAAAAFTPVPADLLMHIPAGMSWEFVSDLPLVSLFLGGLGAVAIVLTAALISRFPVLTWLGNLGRNSIVVYLAFFFPMAMSREILLETMPGLGVGAISLLVTICGVCGPVVLVWLIRKTGRGRFLFERPDWARIEGRGKAAGKRGLQPAE